MQKDKAENGRWYLGTTKTIGSQREVYISDTLYSILLNYKNYKIIIRNNKVKTIRNMF